MDPASFIAAALAAGASAAAGSGIYGSHEKLQNLLRARASSFPAGEVVLNEHALDPNTWHAPLIKLLQDSGAAADADILTAANEVAQEVRDLASDLRIGRLESDLPLKDDSNPGSIDPTDPPSIPDLLEVPPTSTRLAEIESIIALLRSELDTSTPSTASAASLLNLGLAFQRRYEATKDPKDLTEAISHLEKASGSEDVNQNAYALAHLANCLQLRFDAIGDFSALRDSISFCRRALNDFGESSRPWWIESNLARSLQRLYTISGDRSSLEGAMTYFSLAINRADNRHRPQLMILLSRSCVVAYDDFGEFNRLKPAEELLTQVLQSVPSKALRVIVLIELGDVKVRKYGDGGPLAALDDAISHYQTALDAHIPLDYALVWSSLGNAFRARHERLNQAKDLDQAIDFLKLCVDSTPRTSDLAPTRAVSLANSILLRNQSGSRPGELDYLTHILRDIAPRCQADQKPQLFFALGKALQAQQSSSTTPLSRSVALAFRQVLETAPSNFSGRPAVLYSLAQALSRSDGQELEVQRLLAEAYLLTAPGEKDRDSLAQLVDQRWPHLLDQLASDVDDKYRIIVWLDLQPSESVKSFSEATLNLQEYLRNLELDRVEPLTDREPYNEASESAESAVGAIRIDILGSRATIRALVTLFQWWCESQHRSVRVDLKVRGHSASLSISDEQASIAASVTEHPNISDQGKGHF